MKTLNVILFTVIAMLSGCNKQPEETVSPKLLGAYPPNFYYVIINLATGEELVTEEKLKNLRVYFFENGKKIYDEPLTGGAVEYQFPEMKPFWRIMSRYPCGGENSDKLMPFKGLLHDMKCIKVCYEKGINDFFIEWEGKTLGKMTLSTKVVTIANPPPAEGVLGYQTQFVRLDQLKFNDVVVELSQDICPVVYELKVNL